MKNSARHKTGLVISLIIGIGLLIGGWFVQNINAQFDKNAVETTATITKLNVRVITDTETEKEYEYEVYVKFSVDKKEYNGMLNFYDDTMQEGGKVAIKYEQGNPQNFRAVDGLKVFDYATYFLFGFGGLVILIAIYGFIRQSKKEAIKMTGRKIEASIESFEEHYEDNDSTTTIGTSVQIQRVVSYIIVCSYLDKPTNTRYVFRSEAVYKKPPYSKDQYIGTPIDVYVDETNFKKYYVDLDSWLEKIAGEENTVELK